MNGSERHGRYPGPRPYEDNGIDQQLFFGRQGETNELLYRVMGSRFLLLFGESGHGKSSILQAGLFPLLREHHLLPLLIRLHHGDREPLETLFTAIEETCMRDGIDHTDGDRGGLWEYFKTATFWHQGYLMTPVLVFDQFEEIFTRLSTRDSRNLMRHLGELVDGGMPQRIRSAQLNTENPWIEGKPPVVKVIFSLREDYLGALQEFASEVPGLFDNRFRLTALNREQAKEAVTLPAQMPQEETFATGCFRYEDDALEELVDFLAGENGKIEPFQLQLLCLEIEKRISKAQGESRREIAVDRRLLGGRQRMAAILQVFYEDVLRRFPWFIKRKRVRTLCEKGLLSMGHRCMLEANRISGSFNIMDSDLRALVDLRLLRKEERAKVHYYELSHDSLVQPVLESNARFRWRRRRVVIGVLFAGILAMSLYQWADHLRSLPRDRLRETVSTLREEGQLLLRQGDLSGAAEQYRKALGALKEFADQHVGDSSLKSEVEPAFLDITNNIANLGEHQRILDMYQEALDMCNSILRKNPDNPIWLENSASLGFQLGYIHQQKNDLDNAVKAFEESRGIYANLVKENPDNLDHKISLGNCYWWIGDLKMAGNDPEGAGAAYREFHAISLDLNTRSPGASEFRDRLASSYQRIGHSLEEKDPTGAEQAYRELQKIASTPLPPSSGRGWRLGSTTRFQPSEELRRDVGWSYLWIGNLRLRNKDVKGAMESFDQCLQYFSNWLYQNMSADSLWDMAQGHEDLADTLVKQGASFAATAAYSKSLDMLRYLVTNSPAAPDASKWREKLGRNSLNFGDLLKDYGDSEGAEKFFRSAHRWYSELTEQDPDNSAWLAGLAVSSQRIGETLLNSGNLKGAEEAIEQYRLIFSELAAKNREDARWQREIGIGFQWIGDLRRDAEDYEQAEKAYLQAEELFKGLASSSPDDGQSHDTMIARIRLWQEIGKIRLSKGQLDGADTAFTACMEISSALADKEPDNTEWQRNLGVFHAYRGDVRQQKGDWRGAEKAYSQSLNIFSRLVAKEPDSYSWKQALARSYKDLGRVRKMNGDVKGSLSAYEKALELAGPSLVQ